MKGKRKFGLNYPTVSYCLLRHLELYFVKFKNIILKLRLSPSDIQEFLKQFITGPKQILFSAF